MSQHPLINPINIGGTPQRSAYPFGPPRDDLADNISGLVALQKGIQQSKERQAEDNALRTLSGATTAAEVRTKLEELSRIRSERMDNQTILGGLVDMFNPMTASLGMTEAARSMHGLVIEQAQKNTPEVRAQLKLDIAEQEARTRALNRRNLPTSAKQPVIGFKDKETIKQQNREMAGLDGDISLIEVELAALEDQDSKEAKSFRRQIIELERQRVKKAEQIRRSQEPGYDPAVASARQWWLDLEQRIPNKSIVRRYKNVDVFLRSKAGGRKIDEFLKSQGKTLQKVTEPVAVKQKTIVSLRSIFPTLNKETQADLKALLKEGDQKKMDEALRRLQLKE